MDATTPPQPRPDLDSEPFWQATAEGRLALCRCTDCGLWHQPPLERCRRCGEATGFEPISGEGTLHSFIVVRHPAVPGYLEDLPYVVGLIDLDEQAGLRLPARIPGAIPGSVKLGSRVHSEIVPLPGGSFHVPVFRLDAT